VQQGNSVASKIGAVVAPAVQRGSEVSERLRETGKQLWSGLRAKPAAASQPAASAPPAEANEPAAPKKPRKNKPVVKAAKPIEVKPKKVRATKVTSRPSGKGGTASAAVKGAGSSSAKRDSRRGSV
jgi:hypothetical protein